MSFDSTAVGAQPCPFCRSYAVEVAWTHFETFVHCLQCGARGPAISESESVKAAQDAWERRSDGC